MTSFIVGIVLGLIFGVAAALMVAVPILERTVGQIEIDESLGYKERWNLVLEVNPDDIPRRRKVTFKVVRKNYEHHNEG